MNTALASFIFYTYVYLICELLRRLCKKFITNDEIRVQLLELIGTVQVCTPIFDVGVVWDTYGLAGVFIEIFFLELVNCFTLDEACAHPFVLLNHYRDQSFSLVNSLARFTTQCIGAYLSFYLTRVFWAFRLIDEHGELYDEGWHCHSDLTVGVLMGCLYEGIATLVCHLVELQSEERARGFEPVINSFTSAFTCVLGIHLTGMYCNPIVASACTINCDGVDTKGHLIVYWVGPLLGWLQAELANKKISGEGEAGHKHVD